MDTQLVSASPRAQSERSSTPTAKKEGRSTLLTKCVVVLGTLALCLVVLEAGLRVIGRYRMGTVSGYFAAGGLSYVLKKNASKTVFWPGMSWTVLTCDLGFRAARPGPRDLGHRPYHAVLGASEVFGNGLDYEKTFVGVFAEKMRAHNVDVVNLAVAGHHLMEQDASFRQLASSGQRSPNVVLICLNPLFIGGYDDNHENTIVRIGDLFDKDHWRLPLAKVALANSLATYCFFRDAFRNTQTRYFPRKDSSRSFWIERYSTRHCIRTPEKTQDFLKKLKDLEQYIRSLNATPVCVYSPTVGGFMLNDLRAKGELDGDIVDTQFFVTLLAAHCEAEGIRFINFEPLLQEKHNKGERLSFEADAHFNEATSRVVGEYLYNALGSGH